MSEKKLLPCPFCGGEAIYETIEKDSFGEEMPVIFCNWCKVVFKAEDDSSFLSHKERYKYLKEKNAKAWNTRKPVERILERLEECQEESYALYAIAFYPEDRCGFDAYSDAIEIVKEEVEYAEDN